MNVLLPVILVIRLWAYQDVPPVHFERFETEKLCRIDMQAMQQLLGPSFNVTCEVDT
jgi:hypothetical protein